MNPMTKTIDALVEAALKRAFVLGQTYWQQADSDFTSHHKKAEATRQNFLVVCEETLAALAQARAEQATRPEFSVEEYELPRGSAFAPRRYGVRVTHRSGVMAECGSERSQHANKQNAWDEVTAKLGEQHVFQTLQTPATPTPSDVEQPIRHSQEVRARSTQCDIGQAEDQTPQANGSDAGVENGEMGKAVRPGATVLTAAPVANEVKLTADKAAAVDTAYKWRPVDNDTPREVKLQLIRKQDGVAFYGQYHPEMNITHWAPLPTF